MIHFTPAPANDFQLYISTYFARCKAACPKLRAIAGKWRFEDLIPGMSDFDTRLIAADDTTPREWGEMSISVGRVHTALARETPLWARNLEHLPGMNLTVAEVTDPDLYYAEFPQWTYYEGDASALARIGAYLAGRNWSSRDEMFHLRRFATFFGPYQRGIDPAINLGPWESKYPLHSRYMHYFAPPVQAAVSLARRRPCHGKLEALRAARDLFPRPRVIDRLFDTLDRHYEVAADYVDPRLAELEGELDGYLRAVWACLAQQVTLMEARADDSPQRLRERLAAVPIDPIDSFNEGLKFARFMKGRLIFYAQDIPWFDSGWLVRNEIQRIVANFYEKPLRAYGVARGWGVLPGDAVLERVRGDVLSDAACDGILRFKAEASPAIEPGTEKRRARALADVYDAVPSAHDRLGADLRRRVRSTA